MKRVLGMGLVVMLLGVISAPAEAHVKKHVSTIDITGADVDNEFITFTVTGKDKCGTRDIEIRDDAGGLLGSTTTSEANDSSKVGGWDVSPGDTYLGTVVKKRIKRNAAHRHVCKSATDEFTVPL